MKITRENLKNIVREAMVEENAYQEFFKKALEKTGKSIPDMSDEEKKAFFNKIDSAWKGKGEKNEGNAFGAAVADAKKDGDDSFKVGGKEYKVESNEEDLDEEAVVVSKRTPEGNIVSRLKEESVNEEIKVGSSVTVNYPTLKKPIKGKVAHILKSPTGLVYVLAGGRGVWDAKNVSESVNEKADPKKFTKGFERGDVIVNDDNSRYVVVAQRGKQFIVGDNGERREFNKGKVGTKKLKGNLSLKNVLGESTNERMGSDKGAVGNANFNNRLKAMRDDKNSFVAFIDTNKGKKLLKVFKTQQTANQFVKKNMDTVLNTKGIESIGTMSKKEWDAKEAKYAIESVNEEIKVGSLVTVNYPTLKKPIKGKVAHILKSPTGLVYVLAGGRGVWDAKNVSEQ